MAKAGRPPNFLQRDPENGAAGHGEDRSARPVRSRWPHPRRSLFRFRTRALLGNQMQRDQSFEADDRFMFAIDPYFDGRTGYFFEINPSGAMGDGLIAFPSGRRRFGGEMNK